MSDDPDTDPRRPRSEPIRVVSMKEPSEPIRRPEVRHQVQLRAIAEVAKAPASPVNRRAAPRDGRAARARRQRQNLLWVAGGLVLAVALALAIYLVAGR